MFLPVTAGGVPYRRAVSQPTATRPHLRLTRRGRLIRSALALVLAVLLILALVSIVRALGGEDAPEGTAAASRSSATTDSAIPSPAAPGGDGAGEDAEPSPSPTPVAEAGAEEERAEGEEIVRSGTVGDGTWTVAAAAAPAEVPADLVVHTYAVRVEGGIGVEADEAAAGIAEVLADPRGWQDLEGVRFQQVATLEEAEFTISLASPPTVDELCLPARTGGLWSCRVGADVALNSDRWLHATPTYDDLAEYRAYLINHEVGHFLGHGHVDCSADGELSPVMLQQSIDLQGCTPNAWPADEPGR